MLPKDYNCIYIYITKTIQVRTSKAIQNAMARAYVQEQFRVTLYLFFPFLLFFPSFAPSCFFLVFPLSPLSETRLPR